MLEIKEVHTAKEFKLFMEFPYQMYRDNPYWVPTLRIDEKNCLNPKKNPACEHAQRKLFLAYRDGKLAGRTAAVFPERYEEIWKERRVRFGWLDFIPDQEVLAALLQAVENWARELGAAAVNGPMGFCDLDREGLLTEGFDQPGNIYTIYNHPYYAYYLERCGYRKEAEWVEYCFEVPQETPPEIARLANAVERRTGYRFKYLNSKRELKHYKSRIFDLINKSYKELYGVIPLTEKQVDYYERQYLSFLDYRLIGTVVDKNGEMQGIGICMKNMNDAVKRSDGRLLPWGFLRLLRARRARDTYMDMLIIGIEPSLKGSGIVLLLLNEIVKNCHIRGIREIRCTPELETNRDVQALWKYFPASVKKRRRVYVKYLTE